jgi:hypothetical protein
MALIANTRLVVAALALALAGSAMADIYTDNFNNTVLGSSLGLSGEGVGNGQCSELTCNSNYFNITSIPGWNFSTPSVYGYAYNTPNGSNSGLGNGPYNNIAILLNENGPGQISTASNTISGLTVGQTYDLTFQYWGDNVPFSSNGDTYSFDVNINGTDTLFKNVQNIGLGSGNSHMASIQFVASDTTSLIFTQDTVAYGGAEASPIIDNINIAATPEPGFYGVLALGLTGLITAIRRRKSA